MTETFPIIPAHGRLLWILAGVAAIPVPSHDVIALNNPAG